MSCSREVATAAVISFAAGAAVVVGWQQWRRRHTQNAQNDHTQNAQNAQNDHAGATVPGQDLSLYYGNDPTALTTIHDRCKFLASDLYANVVRNTVVCCVDIVLVVRRPSDGRRQCLLVERASEPAKGLWWWPGGRLLKGETFFDAAVRKAQQETGVSPHRVRPVQVLGVWNTFFPTSSWDTKDMQGTQTVNPIVLVEVVEQAQKGLDIQLDQQSENFKWISLHPAENQSEDKYVLAALNRLQAWDPTYMDG